MNSNSDMLVRPTHAAGQDTRQGSKKRGRRFGKKMWLIIVAIVIIAAIVGGSIWYFSRSQQIDSSRYQAVFLNNGQVYFGKLHDYYGDRPYLTNVYYIQGATQGTAATNTTAGAADANQQLVKLGSEIHAPDNEMILNKSSILFVENLTTGGKVTQLIKQNENK